MRLSSFLAFINSLLTMHLIASRSGQAQPNPLLEIEDLYSKLTKNYRNHLVPAAVNTFKLKINLTILPFVLNSFDESEEVISLTFAISAVWRDPRLAWNMTNYNITSLTVEPDDIWVPKIILVNSAETMKTLGHGAVFYATVYYDGKVIWYPGGHAKAKCPANTYRFPFDTQTCKIQFALWGVHDGSVQLSVSKLANFQFFMSDSDWQIVSHNSYGIVSSVFFQLTIKRNPMFNVVLVVLPTVLFCLLNPFVFILPVESGERVSLGMTVLLAYAIFLTLVTGTLPSTSSPMCLLLVVMVVIMLISGSIVLCAIISLHYYYIEEISSVNPCLTRLVMMCCRKIPRGKLSGRHISKVLDWMFIILSYIAFAVTMSWYFATVLDTDIKDTPSG